MPHRSTATSESRATTNASYDWRQSERGTVTTLAGKFKASSAEDLHDPVYRLARVCLYLGLFFSSLLVLRVGILTVGDLLLLASIALAATARITNSHVIWLKSAYSLGAAESLNVIGRLLIVAFALPWLARALLPSVNYLSVAAGWLLAGAATAASGTVLQFLFGKEIIPGGEVTNAGRFTGLTGHVSDMGGIAAMGLVIGIGFVITRGHRFVALVGVSLAAVGLILSGSVSGLLAVLVGLLVYVVRRHLRFGQLVLLVIVGVAVLQLVSTIQADVSALSPVERLLQTLGLSNSGRYATSEIRAETYQVALTKFFESPIIGHGLDPQSGVVDGLFPAHNFILAAMFQGGVLVAIALVALLIRPLTGGWIRADRSIVSTQVLATMTAAIVFAMTAPSLYNRYLWIPVALVVVARSIALAAAPRTAARSEHP
jgi:O-antigen ligase